MKHRIDPKIDCVFKALLGSVENRNLLVHFLNAVLAADLAAPITFVEILNPYNDREFIDDKLSVVDVKASDSAGRIYQVEVQLLAYRHLRQRIIYNWCDLYSGQLQSGESHSRLKPVYSIWLLAENLLPELPGYAHAYTLRDRLGRVLGEAGGIWLLELQKFAADLIETDEQRWLKFFKDGEKLDDAALPDWMNTPEMRQAMSTLRQFSEKERDYHAYQARQNFLREQACLQMEREEALQELEQARREKDQMKLEQNQMKMEQEQMKQELEQMKLEQAKLEQVKLEQERMQQDLAREREKALAAAEREEQAQAEIIRLKALLGQVDTAP
ncbi:MAG: Rpn family recombination-promoting nuclease/putative transposase [Candidatus Methylumidiphilus sp.]